MFESVKILDIVLRILDRGSVGVALGGVIGYFISFYFSGRPRLSYQYFTIVKRKSQKRSVFVVWNSGNYLIKGSDFSSKNPLRVSGHSIQSASLVKVSKTSNDVSYFHKDNEIIFDFDYLKHDEGFVVEIIHLSDKVKMYGDLKISNKTILNCGEIMSFYGRISLRRIGFFGLVATIIFYVIYLQLGYIPSISVRPEDSSIIIYMGLFLVVFSFILSNRSFPTKLRFNPDRILNKPSV